MAAKTQGKTIESRGRPYRPKYPWDSLKRPGDMFFVPDIKPGALNASRKHAEKRLGIQIATRSVERLVDGRGLTPGVLVFRVA